MGDFKYKPTKLMLPTSRYDERRADFAVGFIQMLRHTTGEWFGKPFHLMPWQEQIVRDIFGIVGEDGYRQFRTAYLIRFGSPTVHYELTLYVNEAGKATLMAAEDSVPLLECSVRQGVFTGRIVELGSFDYQAASWYKVTATLAAVSEVSDP